MHRDFALAREIIDYREYAYFFVNVYLIMKILSKVCHLCQFIRILSNRD